VVDHYQIPSSTVWSVELSSYVLIGLLTKESVRCELWVRSLPRYYCGTLSTFSQGPDTGFVVVLDGVWVQETDIVKLQQFNLKRAYVLE
jgi:hypothetical protein